MITLFAVGALLLAGCDEWSGASRAKPRVQGESESEATMQDTVRHWQGRASSVTPSGV